MKVTWVFSGTVFVPTLIEICKMVPVLLRSDSRHAKDTLIVETHMLLREEEGTHRNEDAAGSLIT
jgi:hypothetical protein